MVDKDHDRHPAAEKACRQGRGPPRLAPCHPASGEGLSAGVGCCPAPGGNDWPPTFGSSRGTKAAKGDAELLTPRLARARTTLAIARQGGLPVPMRGSVVSLRPGCPPDIIQAVSSFLESSPSARDVHRVGFAGALAGKRGVCKRGKVCPCRGWQGEHAWRWRGGTVGAGLCSGTRPTVFRSVRCQKCQQGGRTTHHLQMTTPSCEKLTRADREPRGEHRMPPT